MSVFKPTRSFKLGVAALAVMMFGVLIFGKAGTALADQPYVASNLISDPLFTNSQIMTVSDIQTFLNNENSGIKNLSDTEACSPPTPTLPDPYASSYYTHCGQNESAAQIIYDAAQAYGISPRVIMATLQKEQSLITDPSPTQSAINCAMGYNSCSGYVGFFSQVDNGTWQLRTYIELMNGRNWWGYTSPSTQYPCRDAVAPNADYSTGLYPGRTVTFYNPGGTAQTITLANSATAALYCYTPFVGPYSQTGYSGSYNFVQSYENWWGSTQGVDYAFQYISASFSGASTSNNVQGNTRVNVTITAENIGNQSWSNTNFPIRVATWSPANHQSALFDTGGTYPWYNYARPATLSQSSVAPGSNGTFTFTIDVPNVQQVYKEMFDLVADGSTWMSGGFELDLNITPSIYSWSLGSPNGETSDAATGFELQPGQIANFTLKAKNTGNVTWTNTGNPVRLSTWLPTSHNSPFCSDNTNWVVGCYRAATLQDSSVTPGNTGTFKFTVQAPQTQGFYAEHYNLVMEGVSWFQDPGVEFDVNVVRDTHWHMVSQTSTNGWSLSRGQTSQVTLVVQNDGNMTWSNVNNPVRLATWNPAYRISPFCSDNTNWINLPPYGGCVRAANMVGPGGASTVAPGQQGTFTFTVQAPSKTGFYAERFNLVAEGLTWFTDPWLEFDFTVH